MNNVPLFPTSQGGFNTPGLSSGVSQAPAGAPDTFAAVLVTAIGVLTVVAGIFFTFLLLIGAIGFIAASGDSNKVAEARSKITNGLVGLIIVFAAIAITSVTGTILGFPSILDISGAIKTLSQTTGIGGTPAAPAAPVPAAPGTAPAPAPGVSSLPSYSSLTGLPLTPRPEVNCQLT